MARGQSGRLRRSAPTTLLIVLAALAWSIAPVGVSAASGCFGTNQNSWAGWDSRSSPADHEPEGAKSVLLYRNGEACVGAGGVDASRFAWVMIQNHPHTRYVQAGYWHATSVFACWQHFSEYDNGAGFVRHEGPCTGLNENHTAMVKYIPATGKTEMWIDTTRLDTMAANTNNWARPLQVFYSGESHNLGTDIPGYAATKHEFKTMQIQYVTDDAFHGTCGTITLFKVVTNAKYASDAPACNHVRTWTAAP